MGQPLRSTARRPTRSFWPLPTAVSIRLLPIGFRAAADLANPGDRPHYLRGTLDPAGRFAPVGRQESHALGALGRTRALARLEPGAQLPAGTALAALLWAM